MKALITGATGQIAAYLAQHLLEKGYEVVVSDRTVSYTPTRYWRLEALGIKEKVRIVSCSLSSYDSVCLMLGEVAPDEIYHLAANSSTVDTSLDEMACMETNFGSTHRLLRACLSQCPKARFLFMGSSEQFGDVLSSPQDEYTPFRPRNPYGIAKTAAFNLVRYYRQHYGLYACSAISYNQESPLRGEDFVTRKISKGVVGAILANQVFTLGNLEAQRDWGYAGDCAVALAKMLGGKQVNEADDYVVATGQQHSVRQFLSEAFKHIGELHEVDLDPAMAINNWVERSSVLTRPPENYPLVGDPTSLKERLDWAPTLTFSELVRAMVVADYNLETGCEWDHYR